VTEIVRPGRLNNRKNLPAPSAGPKILFEYNSKNRKAIIRTGTFADNGLKNHEPAMKLLAYSDRCNKAMVGIDIRIIIDIYDCPVNSRGNFHPLVI
jgi:hypothetical protein